MGQLLDKEKIIRRPRIVELLELALFPELEKAVVEDGNAALELFGQAISWIASMKETSRKALNCKLALVPIVAPTLTGYAWAKASEVYMGDEWGLGPEHERLLGLSYPDKRLIPLGELKKLLVVDLGTFSDWKTAAQTMGVRACPRVFSFKTDPPLASYNYKLKIAGKPSLGRHEIDEIYREYVAWLSGFPSSWAWEFPHNVDRTLWIDCLDVEDRRRHILDLILMNEEVYLPHATASLIRVGNYASNPVLSLWAFALSKLGWPIFPGERGAGRDPIRVPAGNLWRLSENGRRSAYANLINVVPHCVSGAAKLLKALDVPSIEDASIEKLFNALNELAERLEREQLHTRREALSLANELFENIAERLEKLETPKFPDLIHLPLLRGRRLESINSADESTLMVFDDEPSRSRHVVGIESAFRVPISREITLNRIFALFTRSYGHKRVILPDVFGGMESCPPVRPR